MIKHGGAKTIRAQDAPDDMTEPSETRENDGVIVFVDFVSGALRFAFLKDRPHPFLVDREKQGGNRHAERDGGHEQARHFDRQHRALGCESKEHEGEFAPLRQGESEQETFASLQAKHP